MQGEYFPDDEGYTTNKTEANWREQYNILH